MRMHDMLTLGVESVRISEGEGDKVAFILGTDIFNIRGDVVREKSTGMGSHGGPVVTLEVNRSGVMVELRIVEPDSDEEEAHAAMV